MLRSSVLNIIIICTLVTIRPVNGPYPIRKIRFGSDNLNPIIQIRTGSDRIGFIADINPTRNFIFILIFFKKTVNFLFWKKKCLRSCIIIIFKLKLVFLFWKIIFFLAKILEVKNYSDRIQIFESDRIYRIWITTIEFGSNPVYQIRIESGSTGSGHWQAYFYVCHRCRILIL